MLDAISSGPDIAAIAWRGLSAQPKTLPAKLFYDAQGVALFEAITRLPEYYPTRTETALLRRHAAAIAGCGVPGSTLVEYGASDEAKAAFLLDAIPGQFAAYVPIDVAHDALLALQDRLPGDRPGLLVEPVCADFLAPLALPDPAPESSRFGFFPGSTIGNLEPDVARGFLAEARRSLGADSVFVIGTDLRKSPDILIPAYDDAAGVTAAFNRNMLTRLNREAGADFNVDTFRHVARWNEAEGRIEMHLQSLRKQSVTLAYGRIDFAEGETIHTENSYKYSVDGFRDLARSAGWQPEALWQDEQGLFAIHALRAG